MRPVFLAAALAVLLPSIANAEILSCDEFFAWQEKRDSRDRSVLRDFYPSKANWTARFTSMSFEPKDGKAQPFNPNQGFFLSIEYQAGDKIHIEYSMLNLNVKGKNLPFKSGDKIYSRWFYSNDMSNLSKKNVCGDEVYKLVEPGYIIENNLEFNLDDTQPAKIWYVAYTDKKEAIGVAQINAKPKPTKEEALKKRALDIYSSYLTGRACIEYGFNRKSLDEFRASMRTLEDNLKSAQIDLSPIWEKANEEAKPTLNGMRALSESGQMRDYRTRENFSLICGLAINGITAEAEKLSPKPQQAPAKDF